MQKQVDDLKPSDLEQYPIWEHALDEEGVGMLVVRAELVANDGTRYDGYVYPSYDGELRGVQPHVVTDADR